MSLFEELWAIRTTQIFHKKIHILHNRILFGKVIFISIYPIYLFCCVWLTLFLYFSFSLFLFGWFPTFHNWDLILHVHTIYSILVYYRPFHIICCDERTQRHTAVVCCCTGKAQSFAYTHSFQQYTHTLIHTDSHVIHLSLSFALPNLLVFSLHRYSHSNTLPNTETKTRTHTITRVQPVLHIEWHLFYQMTATVVALNSRVQLYARIVIIHLHEFHGLGWNKYPTDGWSTIVQTCTHKNHTRQNETKKYNNNNKSSSKNINCRF